MRRPRGDVCYRSQEAVLRGYNATRYNTSWSVRIIDQCRICFRWEDGYADDVEITDYH